MNPAPLLLSSSVANLFCYSFLSVKGKNNYSSGFCSLLSNTEMSATHPSLLKQQVYLIRPAQAGKFSHFQIAKSLHS